MNPRSIIIFASGTGSNAQKIIDFFRNDPAVRISLIVSNKPGAGVLSIAEHENIPTLVIDKERFFRGDAYVEDLEAYQPSLIALAGFLWKLPPALVKAFPHKIINIHPALLPNYGGKGMYGHFVHEAVINAKEPETGITIHYVDELYDHGEYIFQARVPVNKNDTADSIASKVLQLEHHHFPRVIQSLLLTQPVQ
jgi:phosphoribosylglycinamide formyltransferase-1